MVGKGLLDTFITYLLTYNRGKGKEEEGGPFKSKFKIESRLFDVYTIEGCLLRVPEVGVSQ